MKPEEKYLTPKQIWAKTGITVRQLKHARLMQYLKDYKESPGKRLYYFSIDEVRKVFSMAQDIAN